MTVTEYWPAPEAWFVGRMVRAPGLPGLHHIDWLYSASGISMQGEGLGLDGRMYHIEALGNGGWVTASGAATSPADGWSAGAPYWRAGGYWRDRSGGSPSRWRPAAGPTAAARYVPAARSDASPPGPRCRCATTNRSPSIRA